MFEDLSNQKRLPRVGSLQPPLHLSHIFTGICLKSLKKRKGFSCPKWPKITRGSLSTRRLHPSCGRWSPSPRCRRAKAPRPCPGRRIWSPARPPGTERWLGVEVSGAVHRSGCSKKGYELAMTWHWAKQIIKKNYVKRKKARKQHQKPRKNSKNSSKPKHILKKETWKNNPKHFKTLIKNLSQNHHQIPTKKSKKMV